MAWVWIPDRAEGQLERESLVWWCNNWIDSHVSVISSVHYILITENDFIQIAKNFLALKDNIFSVCFS